MTTQLIAQKPSLRNSYALQVRSSLALIGSGATTFLGSVFFLSTVLPGAHLAGGAIVGAGVAWLLNSEARHQGNLKPGISGTVAMTSIVLIGTMLSELTSRVMLGQ